MGQGTGGTNSREALKVQADAKGNAVAVMTVPFGDGQRIRAALLPVDGAPTVGIALSDEPDERPFRYHVRLALEPSGGAFVEWTSRKGVPPLKEVLRTRRLRADGTLGQLFTFSAVGASLIQKAFLTMTTEGRGLILYHRSTRVVGDAGSENVLQVLID